jgi:hypothetical protein
LYAQKLGKKIRNIDKKTMELFHAYDWPGNIRELQNVVERAVILSEGETLFVDETWLTHVTRKVAAPTAPLVADLVEHQREMLEAALRESEGSSGPHRRRRQTGNPTADSRIKNEETGNKPLARQGLLSFLVDVLPRPHPVPERPVRGNCSGYRHSHGVDAVELLYTDMSKLILQQTPKKRRALAT